MSAEQHSGDYQGFGSDNLSPEELQASILAAYTLGRWFQGESIQPEVTAATALRDAAIVAGASAEEVARHDHTVKYWQRVQLEMGAVYKNSHEQDD